MHYSSYLLATGAGLLMMNSIIVLIVLSIVILGLFLAKNFRHADGSWVIFHMTWILIKAKAVGQEWALSPPHPPEFSPADQIRIVHFWQSTGVRAARMPVRGLHRQMRSMLGVWKDRVFWIFVFLLRWYRLRF